VPSPNEIEWDEAAAEEFAAAPAAVEWDEAAAEDLMPRPAPGRIGKAKSFLKGAEQGATFGFADELGASIQSGAQRAANVLPGGALDWLGIENRYSQDPLDVYRQARTENRAEYEAARTANPGAFLAGELGGGILTTVGTGGVGAGLKGAALTGAAMGAAGGLGYGESDLTKGDVGGAALETGIGAAAGGVLGAAGHGLGQLAGGVGRFVNAKIGRAMSDQAAKSTQKVDDAIASALGRYRSGVQSGSRDVEVILREAADNPGPIGDRARAFLQTPEAAALRESLLSNKLASAPERLTEMMALKGEHGALSVGRATAIAQDIQSSLASPFKKQILPRVKTYASRAIPPIVASAIGGQVGGTEGMVAGGLLGFGAAAALGRPGTALANAARSPAVRKVWWEGVKKVLVDAPEALGKYAEPLTRALRKGPEHFAVEAFVRHEQDPEFREMVSQIPGE